ncbi:cellulose binding domain-containing protein [Phytohabitans rumicis]|uniref:cellulose binding domain-containing protein n=1 Tax=Phytohabitans rumicis TaxID=1076125 RepID=UPI0015663A84|nr:cellulose binding domain-containing protein [Phytohabitans rumicis]
MGTRLAVPLEGTETIWQSPKHRWGALPYVDDYRSPVPPTGASGQLESRTVSANMRGGRALDSPERQTTMLRRRFIARPIAAAAPLVVAVGGSDVGRRRQRQRGVWNGTLTTSGSAATVKNVAWNGTLGAGASTTFGFIADGTPSIPSLTCTSP